MGHHYACRPSKRESNRSVSTEASNGVVSLAPVGRLWTVGDIGNKTVRGHGLHMSTIESPVLVLNPHVALAQAAEPQRPKVHVPDPVVDLLQAHILTDADGRHVHPARVPSNAAVGADVADFEPIGVLERRQASGMGRGDGA